MRSVEIEDMISFISGNTYNIKIKNTNVNDFVVGDFVYNNIRINNNCHFLNKGNNIFLNFGSIELRYDELNQYEITLIKESDFIDCKDLKNGEKYLIGKTSESKENAKFYTVVSKYDEGYYMINYDNVLIKFMYVSFVNYRVFKNQ
jgi:hypothetical protein